MLTYLLFIFTYNENNILIEHSLKHTFVPLVDLTDADCYRKSHLLAFKFNAISPISKHLSSPVLFFISARTEQQASLGDKP